MRNVFLLCIVLLCSCIATIGQSLQAFNKKKEVLLHKLDMINDSIRYLSVLTNKIQLLENKYPHSVATVVNTQISLRESNESGNTFLGMLNHGDSVILYSLEDGVYLARGNQFIGVIPKTCIEQTKPIIRFNKLVARMIKEQKKPATEQSPAYHSYPSKRTSNTSHSTGASHSIHTGSRGGHYYINSKGNKTYVRKKK